MKKYVNSVDTEKREATMRLYGTIGSDVDGNAFAQELGWVDGQVDVINLRINSPGGYVYDGLSIVSAILSAQSVINVYIDGIAASMAAVIAICGNKVHMYDYAKIMVHNPFMDNGGTKLSQKDQKALEKITDTLRTILSRRGKKEVNMEELMQNETWINADEAKAAGLIDEIISSKRRELSDMSAEQLCQLIKNEYKSTKMDLKAIAKKLGLPESASEADILAAMDAQNAAAETSNKRLIDLYIAAGKASGKVTDKNEERMRKLAAADFDLFVEMVSADTGSAKDSTQGATQDNARLSQAIAALAAGTSSATSTEKTWDWYQKNDPAALARMEKEDPNKFKKLEGDYENGL